MFGDESGNIFWNMIRKQKEDKLKKDKLSNYLGQKSSELSAKGDAMDIIEKLPTYKKICILQGLLKEMKSIKERFEDNKQHMLDKISKNCYNYYKNKIGMKEIYDYCQSNSPEIHINYVLLDNAKEKLSADYDTLYSVLFLLRDNNDIIFNMIKSCPENSYEQLSDFLVNCFYENTIDSTFNEEELMVIIYLVIEDLIIIKMPKELSAISNKNDSYLSNSILYYFFKSLTRKADVRNFTFNVLSENILKLEEINESLTIVTKKIGEVFNKIKDEQKAIQIKYQSELVKSRRGAILDKFKRNMSYGEETNIDSKKVILPKKNTLINKNEEEANLDPALFSIEEREAEDSNNIILENKINLDNIQLNKFFIDTDVTLQYLNRKLDDVEKNPKQNCITNAMKEFFNLQINQIRSENCEIFSNSSKNKQIKKFIAMNNAELSDRLVKTIIDNYIKLTSFIEEILIKLKENIRSLPYILKTLTIIMDTLMLKKYQKYKNIDYHRFMLLSNYLVGNIILPLVLNPNYNGIITTDVISKITKENLEIVSKILLKMLSGKLFNNKKESEYTIFNKFIINMLPSLFDIINSINLKKNFKLPNKIQKLINSVDSIENPKRDINYDYFVENQENIQQQSICFSWLDLIVLIDLFKLCSDLNKNEKYKNYILKFEKFKKLRNFCFEKFSANNNNKEKEFFLLQKIKYNNEFQKNINNILQDSIFTLMSNTSNDDNVETIFKKCLVDVLAYVNILHEENFNYFVQKNQENIIKDNDIFLLLLNNLINTKYKATEFEGAGKSQKKPRKKEEKEKIYYFGLEENENEDADFREVIFPQILDSVKYELGHNLDEDKAKRIVFCSSYLQLHIDDLSENYKKNNYCLLLMEIMRKGEAIINELNVTILNQFYLKVKGGEKLNMIISNNYHQIKKLEKCICVEYLYENLDLPCKLTVKKSGLGIIQSIKYTPVDKEKSYVHSIQSFLDIIPNFRKYSNDVDDIIELEEKVQFDAVLNDYFKDLKALIKNENIIKRYSHEEFETIVFDLENYVLFKLYDKLFPKESIKADVKFYKKCCRLDFVKPENLIKDKKMINEKLWKTSMDLINEMDSKLTPQDKVKNFGKAFSILQNSITFCSGKNDLGIDDTISSLIYVMLKSKPKNIFSNSKYCQLFLDPELSKKQYGILLSQIEMIKNIINDMKYTDLIGVNAEQFGKDEE